MTNSAIEKKICKDLSQAEQSKLVKQFVLHIYAQKNVIYSAKLFSE